MKRLFCIIFVFILILLSSIGLVSKVSAQEIAQLTSDSLDVKLAPGEILPVSLKLSNFGGGKRVDVSITYLVISQEGVEIYKTTETVAVETTSSFVKNIQIPFNTAPGIYRSRTYLVYAGQKAPATTEFLFKVDRKIFGVFQNEFLLYGGGGLILGILMVIIGYKLVMHIKLSRFAPIDYSDIPDKERVFYELISDTVLGMRQKVGDRALDIASSVEGLSIDKKTGRIVKLTKSPSKIIAELVLGYEKTLGKKVSFSFRGPNT